MTRRQLLGLFIGGITAAARPTATTIRFECEYIDARSALLHFERVILPQMRAELLKVPARVRGAGKPTIR